MQQNLSYPDYNNHSVLVSIETFVESTELATVSVYETEHILT